ncbi:hypothetical protein JCM6882_007957 [Rhodosporidiobolus microsporus]
MASSSGSPITQVDETANPVSLADAFAPPVDPSSDTTPLQSPNSPNPGAKPARPPKAAKRPSTGTGVRRDDNASEGTTVVGAPSSAAAAADVSREGELPATAQAPGSAEAAASPAVNDANAAGAAAPVAAANGADVTKRSSTASQSASEQTGESSLSKGVASTASPTDTAATSSTAPAKTASPSPAPPAASTSTSAPTPRSPAPAAGSAPPAAAAKPKSTKSKKGKGGLSFLFACFSCGSGGHDDSPPNSGGLQKRPSTAARILEKEKQKKDAAAATSGSTSSSANEKEKEKDKQPTPVDPETALTPPTQEPLAAADPDTPAGPPPPTAGTSQTGVVLPREETEGVTSGAVVPPGQAAAPHPHAPKTKRKRSGKHAPGGTDGIITSVPEPGARGGGIIMSAAGDSSEEGSTDEDDEDEDDEDEEEEEDEEQGLIARGGVGIPIGEDGLPHPLLDELSADLRGRKCLVLDLDETLVHSSFKMVHQADYVVPVEIENQFHNVYVIKRPGVDGFLKAMGDIYEVVVFTASLSKYADPVLDQLDVHRVVRHRLFRESCYNNKGNYVKDLSQLGRPMEECIIIDNSPASYVFHPNNAVPISSWFNDPHDTELTDLVPFLSDLATTDDVRAVLDANLYQHLQPIGAGAGAGAGVGVGEEKGAMGTGFVQA